MKARRRKVKTRQTPALRHAMRKPRAKQQPFVQEQREEEDGI
jgi:hypothetical protein